MHAARAHDEAHHRESVLTLQLITYSRIPDAQPQTVSNTKSTRAHTQRKLI